MPRTPDVPQPAALIHAFNTGYYATARCGASNADDGDAPATDVLADVTCPNCRRLIDRAIAPQGRVQ